MIKIESVKYLILFARVRNYSIIAKRDDFISKSNKLIAMKTKSINSLVCVFFLSIFLFSCNSNDDNLPNTNNKYVDLKKIAAYHSLGLENVFSQLTATSTRSSIQEITKKDINKLVSNYIYNLPEASMNKTRATKEGDAMDIKLSPNAELVLNSFFSYLIKSSTRESMDSYINNISNDKTFNLLNAQEQDLVIFMMYIAIDSTGYWSNPNNLNKWKSLKAGIPYTGTRGMVGPPAHYWMTSEEMNNEEFQNIVKNDVYGCLTSLLAGFTPWGWCAGGIAGSAGAVIL